MKAHMQRGGQQADEKVHLGAGLSGAAAAAASGLLGSSASSSLISASWLSCDESAHA